MTEYFKKHLEAISAFAEKYPPDSAEVSILDIGTGNGILISKVINRILEEHRIDKINLILLDPSEDMLSVSEKHCQGNIKTKLNISKICCKSQDMTEDAVKIIHTYLPLWFTHCSLSIHHMPCEAKIEFLKKMKKLSQHFIIGDVNWNHDVPEKKSPELIYSVYKSYGFVFQNVMDGDLTEDDIEGAIDNFLLSEAINIIKNDKESRIDYHTTIDEWVKIARQAGFSNPVVRAGAETNGFVHSFLMELT
jgi:hypothetical protein